MKFIKNWRMLFVIISMVFSILIIWLNLYFGIIHQNNVINIIIYLVLVILLILNMIFLKKAITNTPVRMIVRLIIIILLFLLLYMGMLYYLDFHRLRYENEYIINNSEELIAVYFDTDIENKRSSFSEVRYEKKLAFGFECYVLLDVIYYDSYEEVENHEIDLEAIFSKIDKIENKGICYNKLRMDLKNHERKF